MSLTRRNALGVMAAIRGVELPGHMGKLKFTQDETALKVQMPAEKPSDHPSTLKIVGA